jgi:uncharacterized protein (DUF1501 family)
MKDQMHLRTRREFLRATVLGGALSCTIPGFLARTFGALQAEADDKFQPASGRDSAILVVLQMAGGNDGLNTLVPIGNDYYRRARPRLGLPAANILKVSDEVGFHPSLTGFKALYDEGCLAAVQGVGYPNPNRSHFRATEIWQTAADANKFETRGWLGRYFDSACSGCDPTVGVSIGRQMPQAFAARQPTGVCLDNPQNFRYLPPRSAKPGDAAAAEASFRKLNEPDDMPAENSGGTIAALHGALRPAGSTLDYLERVALDAEVSSDKIRALAARITTQGAYPASPLGNSLKLVAKLIAGGLPTRVYYVSQGGYDTHTNQLGTQERLLRDLGDSVRAFVSDLEVQTCLSQVLLMTFSEFGRRVAENANGGTDHGAAAPLFLVGGKLKAGLLGRYPSLAPADLFQGDLKFTTDFRSVYATLLESWLRTSSQPILGRSFPLLEIV